ncbi:hypothetical protein ANN_09412 [Periplaneta americana]|uniref:Uncharacterized protein n=1 Tax=Periplaneta americana TaxID=6978 RepID=A0ABQ8TPU4_PERAM|nr:hypothetical protein ANN_09412 [Periplaneta americana]
MTKTDAFTTSKIGYHLTTVSRQFGMFCLNYNAGFVEYCKKKRTGQDRTSGCCPHVHMPKQRWTIIQPEWRYRVVRTMIPSAVIACLRNRIFATYRSSPSTSRCWVGTDPIHWPKFHEKISPPMRTRIRAVVSWSKASYLGLALRNARWFVSSWGKKVSHEISASVWDRCPPSIVMHLERFTIGSEIRLRKQAITGGGSSC